MLLRGPRRRSHQSRTSGNDFWNRYVFSRRRNRVNEGDDWISDGRVFHRVDAATGNDRRPMDSSRYAGMSSWCDVDERRLRVRRPGRSATRTSWSRYGGARPCSTRNAMTAILKSTRCGTRRCGFDSHPVHSKLLIYCVLWPTQPPILGVWEMSWPILGMEWRLIGTMMCLLAALWVQLIISAGNVWPHNALRYVSSCQSTATSEIAKC